MYIRHTTCLVKYPLHNSDWERTLLSGSWTMILGTPEWKANLIQSDAIWCQSDANYKWKWKQKFSFPVFKIHKSLVTGGCINVTHGPRFKIKVFNAKCFASLRAIKWSLKCQNICKGNPLSYCSAVIGEFYCNDCMYKSVCDTLVCIKLIANLFERWECILLSSFSCFFPGLVSRLNASKQLRKQTRLRGSLCKPQGVQSKIARIWFVSTGMAQTAKGAKSQISLQTGKKKISFTDTTDALRSSTWQHAKSSVMDLRIQGGSKDLRSMDLRI